MALLDRRRFLADVGQGMLLASVGTATAVDLGINTALADESTGRLTFGFLEPLVCLMQETTPEKLLPIVAGKLQQGATLESVVAAAALANARAFGGQDYTGYHTLMALLPALQMSQELPAERRPLPVLKVLYRNASRIQSREAQQRDVLMPVAASASVDAAQAGAMLQSAVRDVDWELAEARFAAIASGPPGEAFNHLQFAVQDEVNVHRVVLAWRSWALLDLTGPEHAHSLLRQSVRFCLESEQFLHERNQEPSPIRSLLPRLLDEYHLLDQDAETRPAEEGWIEHLARTIFKGTREQGATAVAEALSEGFDPEDVGAAISLASNLLVLHDPGREERFSSPEKPPGCVHGDSVGVHATDSANAWRNIARVCNHRNRTASLIVAGFHTAGQHERMTQEPYSYVEQLEAIVRADGPDLLFQLDEAIRTNDQARASAIAHRYATSQLPPRPVFDLLLRYAVSEDGALHAEKYYRTISEEYAASRAGLGWQYLVALARVTASQFGHRAPGYDQAREILGVS